MAAHPLPLTTPRADSPTIGGAGYSDSDQPIGVAGAQSFSDTVDMLHQKAAQSHAAHANKVHAAGRGPNTDITTQSDGGDFPLAPQ